MPQKRKKPTQSARPAQPSQSAPLAVIEQTSQRIRRQRLVNILSFFLPMGMATALVSYVLLTQLSLAPLLILLPVGIWGGLLASALRQTDTQRLEEYETAAALLDEKTLSKERFVTLATLSQPQAETALFPLLQRETTKRVASFAPERDLPFQFDRRVPVGLLVSVVCIGGAFLIFSLPSQTLSKLIPAPLAAPLDIAERQLAALAQLEKKARELAQDGKTPEEKVAAQALLTLAKKLKDPTLTPKEKEQLIDDAEERIQLNISIPQILPIDLKLFATESENDEGEGNQGDQKQPNDKVLAKANEPSPQLKKTPSASTGNEPQQGQKNNGERKEGEQQDNERQDGEQREDAQNTQPQEPGGGLKFDQPRQQGEKKKQPGQQQSGEQQQTASKHDPNRKTPGGDPNKPGDQQNQSPDPNKPDPNPNPDQAGKTDQVGQGKGKSVGKGKAERFSKPGEKPGGFLTRDARFVKVRVPQGYEEQGTTTRRITNTSQAKPKTPYSNAPLTHRPADTAKPSQLIPLEYRAILQD